MRRLSCSPARPCIMSSRSMVGHRVDAGRRVYGCAAAREQLLPARPSSTIRPCVQHRDLVAHVGDDPEVVADEQVGEAERAAAGRAAGSAPAPAPRRRGRRPARRRRSAGWVIERARDRDPLALAAGELVRVLAASAGAQADLVERLATRSRWVGASPCAAQGRAARRRSVRRCCAGRATRTDPGTPSGSRGARAAARRAPSAVQIAPSSSDAPGGRRLEPITMRASVDLPEPDSPTRPRLARRAPRG